MNKYLHCKVGFVLEYNCSSCGTDRCVFSNKSQLTGCVHIKNNLSILLEVITCLTLRGVKLGGEGFTGLGQIHTESVEGTSNIRPSSAADASSRHQHARRPRRPRGTGRTRAGPAAPRTHRGGAAGAPRGSPAGPGGRRRNTGTGVRAARRVPVPRGRPCLPRISTRRRRRGEARAARVAPSFAAASAGAKRRCCWRGWRCRSAPGPRGCAPGRATRSRDSASRGGSPRQREHCPAASAPVGCRGWRRRRRGAAGRPADRGAPPGGCRRPAPAAPAPRPRRPPGRRR